MNVEVNGKVVLDGGSCLKAVISFWDNAKKQTTQVVNRLGKMKVAITY